MEKGKDPCGSSPFNARQLRLTGVPVSVRTTTGHGPSAACPPLCILVPGLRLDFKSDTTAVSAAINRRPDEVTLHQSYSTVGIISIGGAGSE